MKHKKTNVFKSFFLAHMNLYLFLFALFIIGLITGIIHSAILGEEAKSESYTYITTFINALKTKQFDINILFNEFLITNLKPAIFLWLFGLWIIGIPLICGYIAFEGYSIGFVISIVLNSLGTGKGSLLLGLAVVPQEIFLIPILLTLGVNSILFAKAIWESKNRASNIKFDIYRYIFLFILCVAVLIAVTVIQTYIQVPLIKSILT